MNPVIYDIIADGNFVRSVEGYMNARHAANTYAQLHPEAICVTADRTGHTIYNATPGAHECQAGCGARLPDPSYRTCEACS